MMTVPRRGPNGLVDPDEPHAQQIYITSAGTKTSYAYDKLIELVVQEAITPENVFVCGSSYELPVHYGLLNKKLILDEQFSSSTSNDSFARELASIWTGANKDSWFNSEKLLRIRKILKYEKESHIPIGSDAFYIIGVDVARYGGNDSSIMVVKVIPREKLWLKKVVYTENLHKMPLQDQAVRIKQLYYKFMPREIIVDGNGVGSGLIDDLVIPSFSDGITYPPLYVMNDVANYPYPANSTPVIYNIKANASLNSDIYSNLYIQINNGGVQLLANEKIAKDKLLSTKRGQKMSYYAREKFLLPYIMTSRLIDEINNLRLKQTGIQNQITVEQISKRINKDRVSALSYALFRVKYYEDKQVRKHKSNFGSFLLVSSGRKRG